MRESALSNCNVYWEKEIKNLINQSIIFKKYRFYNFMILKVMDRFFHRYFFVANLKKHISSPKALISRHVHVPVHVLMYIYIYRKLYVSTCTGTCTCTSLHVPVPVYIMMYMYRYRYLYISTCTGTGTSVHVPVNVHQYMYMIRSTWTWTWKSIALKCNATIKVTDISFKKFIAAIKLTD
jgi:hypothetical protein